ncbi:ABC transporter ATP-binding protein [Phycicoccus sp. 3266]|uniref:ABC transporter ATP-binding protein n=1 Tax=Phycicoccus sp. 3266 TaxID=2817751 RepID=UPI0028678871|nr:ABC transporter ATP-binding protein [Phycicoccus sp. 3266]MDR6862504.1 ABC-type multidrug transport system fused ATPase/permease subunit [Phycicoccus sp. 3266]
MMTDHARRTLPVADKAAVWRHTRALAAEHRGLVAQVLVLHALAALAALAAPWLVGRLVDLVSGRGHTGDVDRIGILLAVAVVVQTGLTWAARRAAFLLGETVFAQLREQFVARAVNLPLSTVERAGTGDLVARTTNDVEALSHVVRFGVPSLFVASMTVVMTVVAALFTSPLATLPILLGVPFYWISTRRYLRKAGDGYLWERATYAALNGVVAETVDGARTIDALSLAGVRRSRFHDALRECYRAERYTLGLRLRWFPAVVFGYYVPTAGAIVWGGWLAVNGHISAGVATAVTLYIQQMVGPLDELLGWLDEIQVGATSLARVIGVGEVPPDRVATGARPDGPRIEVDDVRYAHRAGHDVLHGVSLDLRPGERLAIVGPSGAGKSTLGRLMAGIDGPREGRIDVGGVPLVDLDLGDLRGEVALVTQEHHVFVGSLADNLLLARPGAGTQELEEALRAVDAHEWALGLPEGLATVVGSGGHVLNEAQSQQVALARLVLADPHTLVFDEATSLLDPRAARHLERSLAAVVEGRTVVAIAHRLHTAHDADRVAVVEDGLVSEIGTHHELVAADGPYAALWASWRDEPATRGTTT